MALVNPDNAKEKILERQNGVGRGNFSAGNTDTAWISASSFCSRSCMTTPVLTTDWAEPSSCNGFWTPFSSQSYDYVELTRNHTVTGCAPALTAAACQNCTSVPTAFSPGICPKGWPASATSVESGITTHWCCPQLVNINFPIPAFMSLPMCYRSATEYGQLTTSGSTFGMCSGNVTSGFLTLTYNTTSVFITSSLLPTTSSVSSSYFTWTASKPYLVTATKPAYSGKFYAKPLMIKFKSGEAGTSSTATPPAGPSAPTPIASSSTLSDSSTKSPHLSPGAKAGVGVGVSLGFIALLALGIFFWVRKRNNSRTHIEQRGNEETKAELSNQPMEAKELSGNTKGGNGNLPVELDVPTEDSTGWPQVFRYQERN